MVAALSENRIAPATVGSTSAFDQSLQSDSLGHLSRKSFAADRCHPLYHSSEASHSQKRRKKGKETGALDSRLFPTMNKVDRPVSNKFSPLLP